MKYKLEITVFTTGAVLMIFELLGSRMLAPFIGTSIYVWSSIIGVIMASLSLGYYFGGKLADRRSDYLYLSLILFVAGLAILVTYFSYEPILRSLIALKSLEIIALIASIVLFAIPGILIGAVTPYAVKLKLKDVKTTGTTVGTLYSISTFGSIVGTFLAGFLLIPFFGTKEVLVTIGLLPIIISFLFEKKKLFFTRVIIILFALLLVLFQIPSEKLINERTGKFTYDSAYNQIFVEEGEELIELRTDIYGIQSARARANDQLILEYTKFFRLDRLINNTPKKALMIGGCGYSYPMDFLNSYPGATIDVVEIDPKMTEVAKKHFGLTINNRVNIFHEDGRTFLNSTTEKYDFIYIDAFDSFYVPHHLTTTEAVKELAGALNDDGAVILNMITPLEGENGKFFRAEYRTYREHFEGVKVFQVRRVNPEKLQNVIILATKNDLGEPRTDDGELKDYLSREYKTTVANDVPVLKDNLAPVEYYMRKVL